MTYFPQTDVRQPIKLSIGQVFREIARGYDAGEQNPYKRVQWRTSGGRWTYIRSLPQLHESLIMGDSFRKTPRVELVGRISTYHLRTIKGMMAGETPSQREMEEALKEVLDAAQE